MIKQRVKPDFLHHTHNILGTSKQEVPMIYGLIFLGPTNFSAQEQRNGIVRFAKNHKLTIDEFIPFNNNPNILLFQPGDTIICYAWSCLCKETQFLRIFIQHLVKNEVCVYSTTSKYHIDRNMDMQILQYAFSMYEDIRTNFWSNKTIESAKKRAVSGRQTGSKNSKHILDGKEKVVWDMYNNGFSMYAISKKMKVSAPTIKRFLTTQN